ncbi:concanavalin A-like lectin/glucanase domain-containing protein, partial [Geopyxis carbonaria]
HDSSSIFIGADATALAPNGRKAVRLESKKRYTHGLFLLDATHVPAGCGTWPAFWTFGPNWPSSGEIDIMEGVNNMPENNIALHTSPGCVVTGAGGTGAVRTKNCDVNAAGQPANEGCSTRDLRPSAFGAGFNANRGGLYAMEWNSEAIKVWFFPRGSAPADAMGARPAPENWGPPVAVFQGACNIDERFREHRIVINTSFCGDWAGSVWGQSAECAAKAASCVDWVANHPKAFKGAYWRILGLRVFSS